MLIYMLECARCSVQYVGQTSTALNLRVNNHLSRIRNNSTNIDEPCGLVVDHFNNVHSLEDLRVWALRRWEGLRICLGGKHTG